MPIELTEEQQRAIDAQLTRPAEAIDPSRQHRYVLLPVDEYHALLDERDQASLRSTSARNLSKRLQADE